MPGARKLAPVQGRHAWAAAGMRGSQTRSHRPLSGPGTVLTPPHGARRGREQPPRQEQELSGSRMEDGRRGRACGDNGCHTSGAASDWTPLLLGAPRGPALARLPSHPSGPSVSVPLSLTVQAGSSLFLPQRLPSLKLKMPAGPRDSHCLPPARAWGPGRCSQLPQAAQQAPGLVGLRRSGSGRAQDTHLRRGHLLLGQACRREERGFSPETGAALHPTVSPPCLPRTQVSPTSLRSLHPYGGRVPRLGNGCRRQPATDPKDVKSLAAKGCQTDNCGLPLPAEAGLNQIQRPRATEKSRDRLGRWEGARRPGLE